MEEEFKVRIGIEGENGSSGSSKASEYEKQMVTQQKNSMAFLGGILKATAVVAAIWTALSPVITPLIRLLSILILVILLPLFPYIKKIMENLKTTLVSIKEGQDTGDSPMESFTGGLSVLFGDVDSVGTAIGIAFGVAAISALSSEALLGVLGLTLGLSLIFTNIGEDEIKNKLGAAGIIGLAAGIATGIATGNPIAAVLVGTTAFALSMSILPDNISLETLTDALKAAGIVGIATALAVGIATGNPILGILAGTLTFILSLVFDLTRDKDPFEDLIEKEYSNQEMQMTRQVTGNVISPELQGQIDNVDFSNYIDSINSTETEWKNLDSTANQNLSNMSVGVSDLVYQIGDVGNESSLSNNLINSSNEFTNMAKNSNISVNNIISSLDRIPKRVVTIHEIKTIRT